MTGPSEPSVGVAGDVAVFALPDRMDSQAIPGLVEDILSRRGAALEVDGAAVRFAGALGVQMLVSALRQWQADEQGYALRACSDNLKEACTELGVPLPEIGADADVLASDPTSASDEEDAA